jgi:hypothetical protein
MEANLCRFILYRFVYKLFSRDILLSREEGDGILLSRHKEQSPLILIEYKKTTTYGVRNPVPGLGQTQ